ncbi:low molecular weight phosphotyrosine protein phosphatase [Facklamia sp. DSM 111018]|uniref:protein-tyrosine-phosphatase n=1 Tax=Facklamia lactis TaxID=2749967 RepID=A0ABS0LTQ4_9LACT|nr:low molecular weight protein-tyrosine-phosphatase [Facklamia lactis]MBG9980891.1 low molecular weight phosphotyrosine protein phosphatase [Facklamia lactis]MBG9986746.1 low molecular weight phosphotyrosine protein phosphatase [Facklamia lactis]
MVKVLFFCLGNICRSPMAEAVFRNLLKEEEIEEHFYVDSAGTSDEEAGNPVHPGTKERLAREGIGVEGIYSRPLQESDLSFDYIIGMDASNMRNFKRFDQGRSKAKIAKLLSFAGEESDIADPWYTGDFEQTYQDVYRGCQALLEEIKKKENIVGKHE